MRVAIITLALAFTTLLGTLTGRDLVSHGPTIPGLLGLLVVILLFVGLLGALLHQPRD